MIYLMMIFQIGQSIIEFISNWQLFFAALVKIMPHAMKRFQWNITLEKCTKPMQGVPDPVTTVAFFSAVRCAILAPSFADVFFSICLFKLIVCFWYAR